MGDDGCNEKNCRHGIEQFGIIIKRRQEHEEKHEKNPGTFADGQYDFGNDVYSVSN